MEPNELILRDNTPKAISQEEKEALQDLEALFNKTISKLIKEKDNGLLIYPHTLDEGQEKRDNNPVISLTKKSSLASEWEINPGNFSGFIGAGDASITIKSRFSGEEDDHFLHYLLQKVLAINVFDLKHSTTKDPLLDFLLFLFPALLNDALSQGLYKAYERREYNDANIRGTIILNRHIRQNMPFCGRVAYRTREFSHDNPLTQLIRHTIEFISAKEIGRFILNGNEDTRASVSLIIQATTGYKRQDRQQVINQNLRPVRHPYFTRYKDLQQLCLQILRHEKNGYGKDDRRMYGILFSMDSLWEEYLNTLLDPLGFKHPNNIKRIGEIYLANSNKYPRYPDFYDKEENGIVIDAKYKRMIDDRNDVNQIITYMYRFKGKLGLFILPKEEKEDEKQEESSQGRKKPNIESYQLKGYGKDNRAKIVICRMDIPKDCSDYEVFKAKMKTAEAKVLQEIQKRQKQISLQSIIWPHPPVQLVLAKIGTLRKPILIDGSRL
ncbi:5-methylcytosine restriction system specificity protein McrC [Porphyromonas cangingivalis]|uniref:5-methylcytosine restriction system specificity protein McrC n=1 Tax=Porphyromonas cangingivalis TaxID=36874 RepID=UPI00069194E5|nr:hypothetical protein [Porphyromonas cangingivalis]